MSEYDPTELVLVCDGILEDGEVSGDEIYNLALWLNDHREACVCWPGDDLIQPLQDVWADGRITKTELRAVSRILLKIRKKWANRRNLETFAKSAEVVRTIARSMNLNEPALPSIPVSAPIVSHSQDGVAYDVDLRGPTCTCPNWQSMRSQRSQGHLTRCCKHVIDAYWRIEPSDGWPGWMGAFIGVGWPPHPKKEWMIVPVGESTVLASSAPSGWADVFAEENGRYDRFGFHVGEERWSYDHAPLGSDKIVAAICAHHGGSSPW